MDYVVQPLPKGTKNEAASPERTDRFRHKSHPKATRQRDATTRDWYAQGDETIRLAKINRSERKPIAAHTHQHDGLVRSRLDPIFRDTQEGGLGPLGSAGFIIIINSWRRR